MLIQKFKMSILKRAISSEIFTFSYLFSMCKNVLYLLKWSLCLNCHLTIESKRLWTRTILSVFQWWNDGGGGWGRGCKFSEIGYKSYKNVAVTRTEQYTPEYNHIHCTCGKLLKTKYLFIHVLSSCCLQIWIF